MIIKVVKNEINIGFNTNLNFKDLTSYLGYLFARSEIDSWSVDFYKAEEMNQTYDENFKMNEIQEILSKIN